MLRKEPTSNFSKFMEYLRSKNLSRYRYLIPISLITGAAFEYFRINWTPFGINFYEYFLTKRKEVWLEEFRQRLELQNQYMLAKYEDDLAEEFGRKIK